LNGIDAGAASLLPTRASTLGPTGSQGSTGTTEAGVSALVNGPALPDAQAGATPQASAQTELSAVALALDAIIRSGGEATPAVVGQAPVWSEPGSAQQQPGLTGGAAALLAAEVEAIESGLLAEDAEALAAGAEAMLAGASGSAFASASADGAAGLAGSGAAGAAGVANAATAPGGAASSAANAVTEAAAQSAPVAALAAALAQTVSGSGLFYESHLAQWLLGQRTPAELAGEPQNRLSGNDGQPAAGSRPGLADVEDVPWSEWPAQGSHEAQTGGPAGPAARYASIQDGPGSAAQNAALMRASAANSARTDAALLADDPGAAATGSGVHPAVIPLVRQQLDLLATGEFRWTGEAWAGVRLDWTVQQDRVDSRDARHGAPADPAEAPWRTRLTLSLPLLGTVDAELTLAGDALAVRVQANTGGAQQLVGGSDALRQRLEALGLALTGLSIREVGGSAPGSAEASKAASAAYARAAAQEPSAPAPTQAGAPATAAASAAGAGSFDWEL